MINIDEIIDKASLVDRLARKYGIAPDRPHPVAFKYADPRDGARWIYDADEAGNIESGDPSLIIWI